MSKKQLRAEIETKIGTALAEYSKDLSDKKFKKHIKKAAKIVADGLAKPAAKKTVEPKKSVAPVKKAAARVKKATPKKAKKAAPKK